jgi:hypothetical protein
MCAAPTVFPTIGGVTIGHIGGTMRGPQKITLCFAEMV